MTPLRLPLVFVVSLLVALTLGAQTPDPAPKEPNFATKLANSFQPTRTIVYKRAGGRELKMDLFYPAGVRPGDRRAALVNFHGGGWGAGSMRSMYPIAGYAAQQGLIGITVQYRLYKPKTDDTVFGCVRDARSAMRYIRAQAAELGVDPAHLVAVGSSAGGHLAAATALFDEINEPGEDAALSPHPEAMILLWPVIDTSKEGYGNAKIGERWRELSPLHHVRAGLPPTLLFHGTADTTVPFKGAEAFHDAMLKAGNRCDFIIGPGGGHGFMNRDATAYAEGIAQIQAFLESLKILPKS